MSDASASRRGSAVNSPAVSVRSTSRSAPTRCDTERGEPVVVAVADLVVGDGVVLVDDRHDAEVEQAPQRLARVEVLRAHAEVVGREQHLPGEQPVRAEDRAEALHQPGLADGGDRLERPDVGGARRPARARGARRRSRPSCTSTTSWPAAPRGGELLAQLDAATRRRARRCSDVIDDVPTLTTTVEPVVTVDPPQASRSSDHRALDVVELDRADAHDVALARAGARQRALDAHLAQAVLHVLHRLEVGEVGHGHDPLGGASRAPATRRRRRARRRSPPPRGAARRTARARVRPRAASPTNVPRRPRNSSRPSRVTAEIVSVGAVECVSVDASSSVEGGDVGLADPTTSRGPVEELGPVAAELVEQDPLLLGRAAARRRGARSRSSTSTRARSTWRRNSCPSPRPSAAPSMRPGMSATHELVVAEAHHAEVAARAW